MSSMRARPATRIIARVDALHERVTSARAVAGLAVLCALVGVALVFRDFGLSPVIFGDEWTYSRSARLLPLSQSNVPAYLYLLLYRVTNACGPSFLECARLLNVVAFLLAAPFVYAVCRRVANPGISAFVAGMSILAPVNAYTAYFMPESLYFLAFWVYAWAALRFATLPRWRHGVLIGALLGVAALIKVHAVALVAAFALFVATAPFDDMRTRARGTLVIVAAALAAFAAARFGLGFAIAGPKALDLLGPAYAQLSQAIAVNTARAESTEILTILSGHGMLLALLAGVPLAALFARAPRDRSGGLARRHEEVRRLAITHLVALLALTVSYSYRIIGTGPYESAGRMHLRYYDFALPLLYILAAAWASDRNGGHREPARWIGLARALPAVAILGVVAFVAYDRLDAYIPLAADSPELTGLRPHRRLMSAIAAIGTVALAAWIWRRRVGAMVFTLVALPAISVVASASLVPLTRANAAPSRYDDAGLVAKRLVGHERNRVAIVGEGLPNLYRALFRLDDPGAIVLDLPPGAPVTRALLPYPKRWVVVVGDHPLEFDARDVVVADGYRLVEMTPDATIHFGERAWHPAIAGVAGLGEAEGWGRWSIGSQVVVTLREPLADHVVLHLQAHAFGGNVGVPIRVHAGPASATFVAGAISTGAVVRLDGTQGATSLIFDVPLPVRPGPSTYPDDRRIGLALESMRIERTSAGTASARR